jgi:hypothetical protein
MEQDGIARTELLDFFAELGQNNDAQRATRRTKPNSPAEWLANANGDN